MRAREALFASDLYEPGDVEKLLPIIREGLSDTAYLDAAIELLVKSGYSLPHAMMMLVPEAWENHETMSREKKDFYAYHACLMEPWDGPAAIAFTDGRVIGATLDRNGLRPARYLVTTDGLVLMASEAGVLDIAEERIARRWRLEPGRLLLVDTAAGRVLDDAEVKRTLATAHPYRQWIHGGTVYLDELPAPEHLAVPDAGTLLVRQQAFDYSVEDVQLLIAPMVQTGEEAVGSMGNDVPLAVLSERPLPLFSYFKQLFAQVTNPPI